MRAIDWEIIKLNTMVEQPKRKISPQERRRLKKKKQRKKRIKTIKWFTRKIIKWTLIYMGIIALGMNVMPGLYDMYLKANGTFTMLSQEEADERIKQIEELMQLNELYYDKKSESAESQGRLATYDIEKDKLRISNVGSYNSSGGMCLRFSMFEKFNYMDTLEPSLITEKIDADEPVVIGINNIRDGHALMVYAYDYVAEDVLKIYVSDSNYTILDEQLKDEERLKNIKQFNQDVKENIYILCVKDKETERWEFIYNPKINHNYTYEGGYNSYIPDTSIVIYQ